MPKNTSTPYSATPSNRSLGTTARGQPLRPPVKRGAACHQCRKKKLKCDAVKPHCAACTKTHRFIPMDTPGRSEYPSCTWDDDKSSGSSSLDHLASKSASSLERTMGSFSSEGSDATEIRSAAPGSGKSSTTPGTDGVKSEQEKLRAMEARMRVLENELLKAQLQKTVSPGARAVESSSTTKGLAALTFGSEAWYGSEGVMPAPAVVQPMSQSNSPALSISSSSTASSVPPIEFSPSAHHLQQHRVESSAEQPPQTTISLPPPTEHPFHQPSSAYISHSASPMSSLPSSSHGISGIPHSAQTDSSGLEWNPTMDSMDYSSSDTPNPSFSLFSPPATMSGSNVFPSTYQYTSPTTSNLRDVPYTPSLDLSKGPSVVPNDNSHQSCSKSDFSFNIPVLTSETTNNGYSYDSGKDPNKFFSDPMTASPMEEGLMDTSEAFLRTVVYPGYPYRLPDPSVMRILIETFFSKVSVAGVLHKARFMFAFDTFPPTHSSFPSTALLHAICATSARFSGLAEIQTENDEWQYPCTFTYKFDDPLDWNSFEGKHASWAKEELDAEMSKGIRLLEAMQTAMILSSFNYVTARWVPYWTISSLAARMTSPLGLGMASDRLNPRAGMKPSLLSGPADPIEKEMRNRIFWYAFAADRAAMTSSGWACTIAEEDITASLPIRTDEYLAGINVENPQTLASEDLFTNHPYQFTDAFILAIKAVILLARVKIFNRRELRYVEGSASSEDGPIIQNPRDNPKFQTLNANVMGFMTTLPKEFREPVGTDGSVSREIVLVHNLGYLSLISLLEHHVDVNNASDPSSALVLAAARGMLSTLFKLAATTFDLTTLDPTISHCWFVGGRIFARFFQARKLAFDERAANIYTQEIDVFRSALHQMGKKIPVAIRQAAMLDAVFEEAQARSKLSVDPLCKPDTRSQNHPPQASSIHTDASTPSSISSRGSHATSGQASTMTSFSSESGMGMGLSFEDLIKDYSISPGRTPCLGDYENDTNLKCFQVHSPV